MLGFSVIYLFIYFQHYENVLYDKLGTLNLELGLVKINLFFISSDFIWSCVVLAFAYELACFVVTVSQQAVADVEQQEQRQVLTVYQPVEGLEGIGEGTTLEVIVTEDLLGPPPKKAKKEHPLGNWDRSVIVSVVSWNFYLTLSLFVNTNYTRVFLPVAYIV